MKTIQKLLRLLLAICLFPLAPMAQATPISSTDIVDQFNPSIPLSMQAWGNVQCYGIIEGSQKVPDTGINGTPLPLGGTLRFGRAPDPSDPSRAALRFTLMPTDPLTASSFRCETAFSPGATGLPIGKVFWHAFAIQIPDWRGTTDEQQLAQWHGGDTSGMLPIFALLVRGNTMRIVLRYDGSASPSLATAQTRVVWSTNNWPPNTWITVVTQALVSTNPAAAPFLRTWINGQRVVNYAGPLGYNQPTTLPYVKHGIYHWTGLNPWDMSIPQRTVHFRRAVLALDPRAAYTPADFGAYVNSP